MDAPTIHYQGRAVMLRPCSPLLSLVISQHGDGDGARVACGALALASSWPDDAAWPTRSRPRPWRAGEDVLKRGQEIYDSLRPVWSLIDRERAAASRAISAAQEAQDAPAESAALAALAEIPICDLQSACYAAVSWATSLLVSEAEVAAAADFSGPPQGG